jgi:hypothetical protein
VEIEGEGCLVRFNEIQQGCRGRARTLLPGLPGSRVWEDAIL